jgi:hypothetical protein
MLRSIISARSKHEFSKHDPKSVMAQAAQVAHRGFSVGGSPHKRLIAQPCNRHPMLTQMWHMSATS